MGYYWHPHRMHQIIYRSSLKARNLSIKISPNGQVTVTFPPFIPRFIVEHFVNSKKAWIEEKTSLIKKNQQDENSVKLFGQDFSLIKISDQTKSPLVTMSGKKITVNSWKKNNHTKILESFLKKKATLYIVKRTQQLAQHMKINYRQVTMRQQKTRWGSCSSQGNLNFNWRLVHHASNIIDYVIIHELSHRKFMDHSKDFWRLVEKYDSEYRIHRGWLKRNGQQWSE